MSKIKGVSSVFLAILLMALIAASASAAVGISQGGRIVAELGDNLFVALSDDNDFQLSSLPKAGGDLTKIDSQNDIKDLLVVGDSLYYVRLDQPAYQIVRSDDGGKTLLPLLEGEKIIEKLSYYDGILYCLVDGVLTLVDPQTPGESDQLNPSILMTDYVIVSDVIYYISRDKTETYELQAQNETVSGTGGLLYSMDITGSHSEQLDDAGFTDLKAYGNYLYLHNMADGYATQDSDGRIWMEGKLYRMNMQTNQLASMNIPYDWASFPTAYGLVVYTDQDVSLYPLSGGAAKKLYTPDSVASVSASDATAYVYEYDKGVLTALPLDGGEAKVLYNGGPIVDLSDDGPVSKETEYEMDEEGNYVLDADGNRIPIESNEEDASTITSSPSSGSSSSNKTGGYVFPNSKTKKLTRSQILNVSKSKWGYGRNEIYARHGYRFNTKKYRDYFNGKSWYKAGGFSTKNLNSTEWYNMELIRDMEIEYGLIDDKGRPSSGSSSSSSSTGRIKLSKNVFSNSSTKKLKKSQVENLSADKLATARNEILARHGYPFKQSKWVNYFKKIGWKKRSNYSYGKLNSIEKYNIELIKKYE